MKKIGFVLLVLLFSFYGVAQTKKASKAMVQKIEDVPVFVFAKPATEYENVGKAASTGFVIKTAVNETSTVPEKTKKFVEQTLKRKEKGKIGDFDAIILDIDKEKTFAIKFKNGISLEANVETVEGVPVYFYSEPIDNYKVVATLDADYSLHAGRGLLYDKVASMIRRTLKKEESGEVPKFDAVIINPEDLSEKLIVFE